MTEAVYTSKKGTLRPGFIVTFAHDWCRSTVGMALNLPKAAHLLRSSSLEYSEPVHGTRNIVLALDSTEAGQKVIEWACSLYKV